jgi:hypothetical protein
MGRKSAKRRRKSEISKEIDPSIFRERAPPREK